MVTTRNLDTRKPRTAVLRAIATLLALGALVTGSECASAWPINVGAGYDYYSDNNDDATRAALLYAGAGLLGADLFVAGLRWDNDAIGEGNGASLGFGFPLAPLTQIRVTGTRFIGDQSYRAWRLKAGPLFKIPTGQTLGIYYLHDDSNAAPNSDGLIAEAGVPVLGKLKARASAGYVVTDGQRSAQGTLGASWSLLPHVELSGDLGLTQNTLVGSTQPFPVSRGGLSGLPLLGGNPSTSSDSSQPPSAVSTLLGLRITFP